ncbi:MAG TPA: hypothetical protein PLW83_05040 [Deltaproteobacteria bacterium]|nr:hypothetical protein [Deltaproteobacteria bacterium]
MKGKTIRAIVAVAAVIAASAAVVLVVRARHDAPPLAKDASSLRLPGSPSATASPFGKEYVKELRKYYGASIGKRSTQAALIGLRDYFASMGAQGAETFAGLVRQAFPEEAGRIMETIAKLDLYERWLRDNRKILLAMSPEERLDKLWRKRTELFGDEAREIWTGEMLATEARMSKVRETLETLNEADGSTMEEKLEVFTGVLEQTYGGTPESFVLEQKDILSKVFFSIDSVQEDLKRLDPVSRQERINAIRRKMGFTEEQVASMARRDADRELRWQTGLRYMEDRDELTRTFQGEELERKLRELRERYFDDEALTIELEEKDGFFRFKRPRIYGRN